MDKIDIVVLPFLLCFWASLSFFSLIWSLLLWIIRVQGRVYDLFFGQADPRLPTEVWSIMVWTYFILLRLALCVIYWCYRFLRLPVCAACVM